MALLKLYQLNFWFGGETQYHDIWAADYRTGSALAKDWLLSHYPDVFQRGEWAFDRDPDEQAKTV